MPGRGLLTAACLIFIALACLSVLRKLDGERRLLGKLRARGAIDPRGAVPLEDLSQDERDWARSLAAAKVLSIRQDRCYIRTTELPVFRRKRVRLAMSGALGALLLAIAVVALILHR